MDFIDNVNFVFALRRRDNRTLAQIADIVDASVACGIDFNNIEIIVFEFVFEAVNFVSENAGDRGFTGSTWADEKIGVGDFAIFNGMRKNVCDLRLSNNLIQTAWSVPPVQRLHNFIIPQKKSISPLILFKM